MKMKHWTVEEIFEHIIDLRVTATLYAEDHPLRQVFKNLADARYLEFFGTPVPKQEN